jgi:hypothetical protein
MNTGRLLIDKTLDVFCPNESSIRRGSNDYLVTLEWISTELSPTPPWQSQRSLLLQLVAARCQQQRARRRHNPQQSTRQFDLVWFRLETRNAVLPKPLRREMISPAQLGAAD